MLVVPVVRSLLAEQQRAGDVRRAGHHQDGQHHERHHRHQLGDQQPGAADRPDQHVAQRPGLPLPRDRVARRSGRPRSAGTAAARSPARRAGTACRRSSPPTGTPGPVPGARPEVGDGEQDRDQGRQRVDQQDRHPRAPAQSAACAARRAIMRATTGPSRAGSPRARRPPASAAPRPATVTGTPPATSRALSSAGSPSRTSSRSPVRPRRPARPAARGPPPDRGW